MGIDSTLITGFEVQLTAMINKLQEMEGYSEEDYNPYYDMVCSLEEARDNLHYVKKDLS